MDLPKRYAYLMGANGSEELGIKPLKYAEKDIERLERAFCADHCGFEVTRVVAQDPFVAVGGLERLTTKCKPSDLLVVHFSGHALLSGGLLYLVCNLTECKQTFLTSTALEISLVKRILSQCEAKHKLLILDCCHAAASHDGGTSRGKSGQNQEQREDQDQDRQEFFQNLQLASGSASVILFSLRSWRKSP